MWCIRTCHRIASPDLLPPQLSDFALAFTQYYKNAAFDRASFEKVHRVIDSRCSIGTGASAPLDNPRHCSLEWTKNQPRSRCQHWTGHSLVCIARTRTPHLKGSVLLCSLFNSTSSYVNRNSLRKATCPVPVLHQYWNL